jgi:RNA polymerase sigma factor (sigma-70 family)
VGLGEHLLVRRLKRGDPQACAELIRRHHHGVYGYLRRLGADAHLAEDLTQETYAQAWSQIGTLRQAASLRSWLLTIARNRYFRWGRARRPEMLAAELPDRVDEAPSAEEAVARVERDGKLRAAVARLEPSLQEAVSLHYFQHLSLREVGAVLGVPAGTAKSRIHRALGCLRSLLDGEEGHGHEERTSRAAVAGDL